MASFTELNAQVLGISIDHIPCLQAWAESLGGIQYPLLSDFWPHGAVAECYGVFRTEGYTERAIFVIDGKGVIRYIDIHDINDRPDNEEVRKVLRQLQAEEAAKAAAPAGVFFGDDEEEGLPAGDVVLYCTRWCKDCKKAKAWLEAHGLSYVEVDIDYNMTARKQVRKWANGFLITPVIQLYGEIILDFDERKLEDALRSHSGG